MRLFLALLEPNRTVLTFSAAGDLLIDTSSKFLRSTQ
jgi:hypothetical protein